MDDRQATFNTQDQQLIARLCDRHFGIGADGLMLLREHDELDFEMVYFNADGRTSSMCGNGGRCIVKFASDLGMIDSKASFMAIDGLHRAEIMADQVRLEMTNVAAVEDLGDQTVLLDTGSPHVIKRVETVDLKDFKAQASAIRYSERFRDQGVNVNFITNTEQGIAIRTYERGVEDETLACGTGVTAAAIAMHHWGEGQPEMKVSAVGGELAVSFDYENGLYSNVWKTGPAEFVFKGEVSF